MSIVQQKYQTLLRKQTRHKGLANAVVDAVNTKDTVWTSVSADSSTDTDVTPRVAADATDATGVTTTSSTAAATARDSSEPHLCPHANICLQLHSRKQIAAPEVATLAAHPRASSSSDVQVIGLNNVARAYPYGKRLCDYYAVDLMCRQWYWI